MFRRAVKHKKPWRFNEELQRLKGMKKEAYDYVTRFGAVRRVMDSSTNQPIPEGEEWEYHFEKWAQCHDGGLHRWGILTTNGSESLNNVYRVARQLPICAIVERTFYKAVEWYHQRRKVADEWHERGLQFPPKIMETIRRRGEKGRKHRVIPLAYEPHNFEVINTNAIIEQVLLILTLFH